MDLIRPFRPEDQELCMEFWSWIDDDFDHLTPRMVSAFGDVFLEDNDGGFWYLDGIEGSLTHEWNDSNELRAALETEEGQDRFLLAGLAMAAAQSGLVPGPEQVFAFTVPPMLGGELSVENLELLDLVVALGIGGQLHEQVKDLPPGTEISLSIGD